MKHIFRMLAAFAAITFLAAPAMAASPGQAPATTSTSAVVGCTFAKSDVSVTTTSASLLAANSARKGLSVMNTGTGYVTIVSGTGTATAGSGINLSPAPAAGQMGGSWDLYGQAVPIGAFQVIGAAASTVHVEECS